MAVVNKTDRKKLVSTEVLADGATCVWFDARTGGEFARIDLTECTSDMQTRLAMYGLKQIVADIVSGLDGPDAKIKGMAGAVAMIEAGQWPRRAPAEGSLDRAIAMLMQAQGIDRGAARAMLGLGDE